MSVSAGRWPSEALDAAQPKVFWSDSDDEPEEAPHLKGELKADLTIIGGGFTGLWAAIYALEEEPGLTVALLEAERCGFGASSRNGGFCDSSLTHGLENGISHWPDEIETLIRFGRENLDHIESRIKRYGIDADFHRVAETAVATESWQLESLSESVDLHTAVGDDVELLDEGAMKDRIASPTYVGGLVRHNDVALVDPARLCWGLQRVAESLGAMIFENSRVIKIERFGSDLQVITHRGSIRSERVVVATNAYEGPHRSARRFVIPVYDHVLMTEPLDPPQLESLRWRDRDGVGDASNQFHYYRLSKDNRILWGGYDATYHYGSGVKPQHDQSEVVHMALAEHFFETFPQLEGLLFTHRWGGPIGTTTRFTVTWGTAERGQLVWAGGYTGLGVGASLFGARVALDLVFGRTTERTELEMVRKRPTPFPPEPLRWTGVQLTRRAMQSADENSGRRGPWLRLLDRFGIGFDS